MLHTRITKKVAILQEKFRNSMGLPFQEFLPTDTIQTVFQDAGVRFRHRLYSPQVTLWAWLSPVLDQDTSCKKAVSRIIAYVAALGVTPPSEDTGADCKARNRLPESVLWTLVRRGGTRMHQQAPPDQLWCGRRVFLVDGSSFAMADTPVNQSAYPQPTRQALGCGFPVARIVARFCLSTGTGLDAAIGALSTHELPLFRRLVPQLPPGNVALGDRLFGSYADIYELSKRSVDCVFRLPARRQTDFRTGRRLGRYDHLVYWTKPRQCPIGLAPTVCSSLPERLLLREVRFSLPQQGFRTQCVTLVTTLLDPQRYARAALTELYGWRWTVEIDLRHLKTTMQMEHLSTQTPALVQKECVVYLLAYNLIRTLMWTAGIQHAVRPLTLSFQATIQHFSSFAVV